MAIIGGPHTSTADRCGTIIVRALITTVSSSQRFEPEPGETMRITPATLLLIGATIALMGNGKIIGNAALAAAKQTCTTDPYGTRTCTDNPDVKTPKKQK